MRKIYIWEQNHRHISNINVDILIKFYNQNSEAFWFTMDPLVVQFYTNYLKVQQLAWKLYFNVVELLSRMFDIQEVNQLTFPIHNLYLQFLFYAKRTVLLLIWNRKQLNISAATTTSSAIWRSWLSSATTYGVKVRYLLYLLLFPPHFLNSRHFTEKNSATFRLSVAINDFLLSLFCLNPSHSLFPGSPQTNNMWPVG